MTTGAIIMMIVTMGIVTAFTAYFFFKILKTPQEKLPPDDNKG